MNDEPLNPRIAAALARRREYDGRTDHEEQTNSACCGGKPCSGGDGGNGGNDGNDGGGQEAEQVIGGCCGGKPCGGAGAVVAPEAESRYPQVPPAVDPSVWARGAGADQFADYARGLPGASAEPYTYAGEQLGAFAFPLGGFGAGHVVLRGDGTLQKWCVCNQAREECAPHHAIPRPSRAPRHAHALSTHI